MSRSSGWIEEETSKLDESFRKALADIRPYVLSLTSTEDAKLCGMWLDKLSCITTQRYMRNEYMVELRRQLRTGRVGGIFTQHPPNGPLQPLSMTYEMTNNVMSPGSECSGNIGAKHEALRCQWKGRNIGEFERPTRMAFPRSRHQLDIDGSSASTVRTNGSTIGLDPETGTDGQTPTMTRVYAHRMDVPTAIIKELRGENERLERELRGCVDYYANSSDKPDLRIVIEQLREEVTSLKAELGETKRAKDTLEENHRAFAQRCKSTMADQLMRLEAKQKETERENRALTVQVAELSQKLEDARAEGEVAKQKLTEKYDKLEARYEILPIERKKDSRMNGMPTDQRDKEMSQKGEVQRTIPIERYDAMREKFCEMKSEMDLVANKRNQSFFRKIDSMKKTICKLEKSKEKLICNYEKRISRIIQGKELEIKALQLRLHGQKGELSVSLTPEKQCQVGNLMDALEERYKAILAAADATAENQRQSYLKKIMFLEEQLTRLKKSLGGDGEGT